MSTIVLTTVIQASIETLFDLSRNVDVHMISTRHTNETVQAGKTTGLFVVGDRITWKARHLGFYQLLTVEIIKCDFPNYFRDQMGKGAFKSFTHRHNSEKHQSKTVMKDIFELKVL